MTLFLTACQIGHVLLDREVAETRSVEHLDVQVEAPGGIHVKVTHVCKTVPMDVWVLTTSQHRLECAGKHLVVTEQGLRPVDQLQPGDWVDTDRGKQLVRECRFTGLKKPMYDLRVDSDDHLYFTEGIASHNSTGLLASSLFKLNVFPSHRSIYLAPLKEHTKTMADVMMDMQRGSIFPPDYILSRGYRNNMYYKESPQGGFLKLMHILSDPTKIRGNSAPSIIVDESQDFDSEHLPEIAQVQKAFRSSRTTIFAGTSKDLDTCLEAQYQQGSRGIWHVPCSCRDKFHPLNDPELIPKMMSVEGLKCPNKKNYPLNPMGGFFVHEDRSRLAVNHVSFHLPQLIVPEYSAGAAFVDIWNDFKNYPYKKFLMEVMGIAVDSGMSELTERDLKACCSDKTFAQIQQDYLQGRTRYVYVISGCDWGGSDWNPATRTKQSYTVHTIYGLRGDGKLELIYAYRYAGMNYREIAGHIVDAHNKFQAFAMGTDNGGGAYYNAYMRDCGRIPTNRIISFNYSDTKLMMSRIDHPESNLYSLHRTDSLSALIEDIKSRNIIWPRWDDASGFVLDCLNLRRNITEAPTSGRTVMRYIKHGAKADDFMQSTNYAAMVKRIITRESLIPNEQLLREIAQLFGLASPSAGIADDLGMMGGHFSG